MEHSFIELLQAGRNLEEATQNYHGVQVNSSKKNLIYKTGISKVSGRQTLAVPSILDIFYWDGQNVKHCTFFSYFLVIGRLLGDDLASWTNKTQSLFIQDKMEEGYYIVNHKNHRGKYLGQDWNKICDYLDGKSPSFESYLTII